MGKIRPGTANWAFVGGGNMTDALVRGISVGLKIPPEHIVATDILEERRNFLVATHGIRTSSDNASAVAAADVVILAVKPPVIPTVLAEIAAHIAANQLVISVAAGITTETIQAALRPGTRIVRAMPNTPAMVLAGATGLAMAEHATQFDIELARRVFGAVGRTVLVPESLMDAVTGLSASGPAFVFTFIESLADGGVLMGIPRATAVELAAQTVLGSAKMVLESARHTSQLKDMVTSPGGTTIHGMRTLENGAFRGLIMDAVQSATKRSRALGRR